MHSRGCSLFTMNVMTLGSLRECGLHPIPMVKGRREKPCHSMDKRSSTLYGRRNLLGGVLFCFVSFFGLKTETLWDYSKVIVFAKERDSEMGWFENSLAPWEWQDGFSSLTLGHQRFWLIKWTFDPQEIGVLGTVLVKRILPSYLGQFVFLVLAVMTMVSGSVTQNRG